MKKILAMVMAVCMMCMCTSVFAATYSKDSIGISFILSDNWYCVNEDDENMYFEHSWSDNEMISVSAYPIDGANSIDDVSEADLKAICMEEFSNENLAYLFEDPSATITSNSTQARYEWYGGVKYYRFEKAFSTSGYRFYTQGWYVTALITAKNGCVCLVKYYRSDVSGENHFADVVQMLHSMSFDGYGELKVGDVIGEVLHTDIKAYVDYAPIPSYNIAGYTAVVAEDLRDYGFEVEYDNNTRSLWIWEGDGQVNSYYQHSQNYNAVGSHAMDVYYTDITTYINGQPVEGYNVNGYTVIFMDDLATFGNVEWDQWSRTIAFSRY